MKTKITTLLGAALGLLVTLGLTGEARTRSLDPEPPQGLNASDWSGIRAEYERQRHAVVTVEGQANTWQARNPRQQWRTTFDAQGFLNEPDSHAAASALPGWKWGLELKSYGFAGHERPVKNSATVTTDKNRVTYDWDDTLDEWFINDTRGLEHGFTIRQRPAGASSDTTLNFTLAVRGGLRPVVDADGHDVRFVNPEGTTVLTYGGLHVFDADGKEVLAKFEPGIPAEDSLHLAVEESSARYPLTIDPIVQQAYLKASNAEQRDLFGSAVAISGNTVVIGAPWESSGATGVNGDQSDNSEPFAGAVYVFVRDPSTGEWTQQAYLKASNADANDRFGSSVAISGDLIVVGAPFEASIATGVNGDQNNNFGGTSGAAYVFVRTGTTWTQEAYLKRPLHDIDFAGDTAFAGAVAVSRDTVVVNDVYWTVRVPIGWDPLFGWLYAYKDVGAVHVFVRSGGVWSQQAMLLASNSDDQDLFGHSVAIDGDTVVAGAWVEWSGATGVNGDESDNTAAWAGAAYVFVRDGTTWTQQAYLKASNTDAGDRFGNSVAVSGNTILVGAPYEDSHAVGVNGDASDNSYLDSGAAYVFARSGSTWTQEAYIKASNTDQPDGSATSGFRTDLFGFSVALSGNTAVISAPFEDSAATGVDGNQLDNSAENTGAVYVFERGPAGWAQVAYVKAWNADFDGATYDLFGHSVAVSSGTVVAGANGEDSAATGVNGNEGDNSALSAGAAYVFAGFGPPPCANPDAIIWHQPLARNGASEDTDPSAGGTLKYRFKLGSTIPIKVHVLDCDGVDVTASPNVVGAVEVFEASGCEATADGNALTIDYNGVGGTGGAMDKVGDHLMYNLDTSLLPQSTSCYLLQVTVTDTSTGESHSETVPLQAK